jgi:CheY-like chemotaxis protein
MPESIRTRHAIRRPTRQWPARNCASSSSTTKRRSASCCATSSRGAGHGVALAHSGVDALRYLEDQEFDVVLTDVKMPEMDGSRCTTK